LDNLEKKKSWRLNFSIRESEPTVRFVKELLTILRKKKSGGG